MQRLQILHRTYYNYANPVTLGPHTLRLRPRENHQLRIESWDLTISPTALLRWHRDAEDNSVAVASFDAPASQLLIESKVVINQYNEAPFDFVLSSEAEDYPFAYSSSDAVLLTPYMDPGQSSGDALTDWVAALWRPGESVKTGSLLERVNRHINTTISYQLREEAGVQSAATTLAMGSGSCRDLASLFMEAVRRLGFASRFVSGYLDAPPTAVNFGATHAWAEVYLPGAGWMGYDPTMGDVVGPQHIAVAVSRLPESVPPIAGSFVGSAESHLDVGVWVRKL